MTDTPPSENQNPTRYAEVPEDFPRPDVASAVAGFQSKLAMVEYEGKLYLPGGTPPERWRRWDMCEDLAVQLVEKCRVNQAGKYSHLSESEILDQYFVRLVDTGWGSDAEMRWVICRTAGILGWPVPASAIAATPE